MTYTVAQTAAKIDQKWVAVIKIEGVGHWLSGGNLSATDGDGQTKFFSEEPDYITPTPGGLSIDRPYLLEGEWPEILSERADVLGGLPESGELSFSILDVGNYLTDLLRTESDPIAVLDGDLSSTALTMEVQDGGQIAETSVCFIGGEALRVSSTDGPTSIILGTPRGYLGTTARRHLDGDLVYNYIPYLRSRRVELLIVPKDGAITDEVSLGQYVIDSVEWSQDMNTWNFRAKSQLKYLHRLAPPAPDRTLRIVQAPPSPSANQPVIFEPGEDRQFATLLRVWTSGEADSEDWFYLRAPSGEVVTVKNMTTANGGYINRRGVLGTTVEPLKVGDHMKQVFCAEITGPSSFRFSPGGSPSTARTGGTWTKTAHWVDLMLLIMCSSADPEDQLELDNRNDTFGAFDSLPVGYGIGLPHTLVDWGAWLGDAARVGVKPRTPEYLFPSFIYGDEPMEFGELITENFLKPIGAYIISEGGLARIALPRIPLEGDTVVTLGPDEILQKKVGGRQYLPRLNVRQNVTNLTGSVRYLLGSEELPITINNTAFDGTYGQRGLYSTAEKPIEIAVPGVRYGVDNTEFLEFSAMRRLFRFYRPTIELDVDVDMAQYTTAPADIVAVTVNELPNLSTGTRDWASVKAEVLEREVRFDEDLGAHVNLRALGYGGGLKVGKISPSARVVSFTSDGDDRTLTVTANRYTQADANGNLPATDAAGFAVGDIVQGIDTSGALVDAATQEVTAISSNDITIDGDFNGGLANDVIIIWAEYGDSAAQQTGNYVYFADREGDLDIGASGVAPWRYGEP